tara:strand:- start:344 stop:658 length:315 start_codon:yes stop_codon:yes gene_type:complete
VKKYFYILFAEVLFGAVIIEPESQIQNSIYYDSKYEDSYYKIGDSNTSFNKDSLEPRQSYELFSRIYEWPSDYLIQILYLNENVIKTKNENNKNITNYFLRQLK